MTAERGVVIVRLARDPTTRESLGWRYAKCCRCFWHETDQATTRDIYEIARGHIAWHERFGPAKW